MATKRLTCLLVLLLYFLAQTHFSNGQDYRIPFISVQSCAETQFFDIGGLICRPCGDAMIASSDGKANVRLTLNLAIGLWYLVESRAQFL